MTTLTLTTSDHAPLLVSELPPVPAAPKASRLRRRTVRRELARFEAVLREVSPQERTDLLHAAARRS